MSITEKQRLALKERLSLGRGAGAKSPVDTSDVVKRYLAGERVVDIAAELGVQALTIYRHLRKARDEK